MKIDQKLLEIYNQELIFIRKTTKKLAEKNNYLSNQIKNNPNPDPFIQNLIDGFALLNARTRYKINQDVENLSYNLINTFNPTYLKPIPSMAVINFLPEKNLTTKKIIQKNSLITIDHSAKQKLCFSTCYNTEVLPLETTTKFTFDTNSFLINFSMTSNKDVGLSNTNNLRLYINLPLASAYRLITAILNTTESIKVTFNNYKSINLSRSNLKITGLKSRESLLSIQEKNYDPAYLFSEFFIFPQKFLFLEIINLEEIFTEEITNKTKQIDFCFTLKNNCNHEELEKIIKPDCLLINCTPVINLFDHPAKPFRLTQIKSSYQIKPEDHNIGLYSINKVYSVDNSNYQKEYAPLFSKTNHSDFYFFDHNQRLSFHYNNSKNITFGKEIINISLICYNTELNEQLLTADKLAQAKLLNQNNINQIVFLTIPTKTIFQKKDIAIEQVVYKEVKTHRSSLLNKNENLNALKNIIQFAANCVGIESHPWLAGLIDLKSKAISIKTQSNRSIANFYQGTEFILKIDTVCFNDTSWYLFGCIVNEVLNQLCDINAFIQLSLIDQNNTKLCSWLPYSDRELL